jgi:hypothetical protein
MEFLTNENSNKWKDTNKTFIAEQRINLIRKQFFSYYFRSNTKYIIFLLRFTFLIKYQKMFALTGLQATDS